MRNFLLSAVLVAVPAMGFFVVEARLSPPVAAAQGLGDLSAYQAIAADLRKIAASGDLVAAEKRATDLEDLWDKNADRLQAQDAAAWGVVDGANDALFSALRATVPEKTAVLAALDGLDTALAAPVAATGAVQQVAGIDVTDAGGHPLPCEKMAQALATALGATAPSPQVADLQAKALERCNADDDARSDAFSAQAIALVKG